MRYGDTARLLRIVEEVSLRVLVRVVADNLDRVFVRADGTVRAETVEFTARRAGGCGVELLGEVERGVGNVLINTDSEVVFRRGLFEVFVNREHHGRGELLRTQAVSSAYDLDIRNSFFEQRRANVEIQGLAEGAGLFRSVEYGDFLCRSGQRRDERVRYERSVKTNFDKTVLLARSVEFIYGFFDGFAARAHTYDDFSCVGRADVVEQVIVSAAFSRNYVHHFLNDSGGSLVIAVRRLSVLEISIAVLGGALLYRVFGVERARLEVRYIRG